MAPVYELAITPLLRSRISSALLLCCSYAILFRASADLQTTDITLTEGDRATLKCDYAGDAMSWRYYTNVTDRRPSYIVTSKFIVYPQVDDRYSLFYNGQVYNLVIESVTQSDQGVYKCAYSSSKLSEALLRVVPKGWPRCNVVSPGKNEPEPLDVTLECDSGLSNNFPQMRWFREDTELESATQARLDHETSLTSEDKDVTYTCGLGDGDIRSLPSCRIVPYPSRSITGQLIKNSSDTVVGGNVTFVCTGSAKTGNVSIVWDRSVLSTFADRFSVRSNNTKLELFDIRPSDDGTLITCTVTASNGTFHSFTTVLHVVDAFASDDTDLSSGINAGSIIVVILLLVAVAAAVFAVAAVIGLLRLLMRREDKGRASDNDGGDALEMEEDVITHSYESPVRHAGMEGPVGNDDAEGAAGASRDELQVDRVSHGRNTSKDVVGYLSLEKSATNLQEDYEKLNSNSYEVVNTPNESLVEHDEGEDLDEYGSVRGTGVSDDDKKAAGLSQLRSSSEDMDGYLRPMQSADLPCEPKNSMSLYEEPDKYLLVNEDEPSKRPAAEQPVYLEVE